MLGGFRLIAYVVVEIGGIPFAHVCRNEREAMEVQAVLQQAKVRCFAGQAPDWFSADYRARQAVRPNWKQMTLEEAVER